MSNSGFLHLFALLLPIISDYPKFIIMHIREDDYEHTSS